MEWLYNLFLESSVAQTIVLLCGISIIGLGLGRVKLGKTTIGSGMVFFAAIAAGHFIHKYGIEVNSSMMDFAKNFGLVIFVYFLGVQCGPGFFSAMRKGGRTLIGTTVTGVLLGALIAVGLTLATGLDAAHAVGLLSGSVTNTPSMIAAQQTFTDLADNPDDLVSAVGAGYAVAYPFSIFGVMMVVMLMKKLFPKSAAKCSGRGQDKYTAVETVMVSNPAIFDKSVKQVVRESGFHFVISRLWRDGNVQIPMSETVIEKGDRLMVICEKENIDRVNGIFGTAESKDWNLPDIDWNIIDKNLVSRDLRVTAKNVIGISLSALNLRNTYGVNITRIHRSEFTLVPSSDTKLQFGDMLTVVGDEEKIKIMEKAIGNEMRELDTPRLIPILLGIFLGVVLGSIPVFIPGMSAPLKLGIVGGPIVFGILMGAFGPDAGLKTYVPRPAIMMFREMGITFFFAAIGLSVGENFVETVFCLQGLEWALMAIVISTVPLVIMGILNEKVFHLDFARSIGTLCGSVTNPNALSYSVNVLDSDTPAEVYATVYPIVVFLRIIVAQIFVIVSIS